MKKYFAWLLLACSLHINSQNNQSVRFSSPFDFPLLLSGNFGELRANHFHAGLDFKTQGQPGKWIRALGDGYISKARVTQGSGYVLEITYDSGYTSVFRHDEAYANPLGKRIEDLQYEKESYEVEITPAVGEYRVKAGQLVGRSGNLGYSFGPHLHLELLETATGDYVDPLPFFKNRIGDSRAPVASGFMLIPQRGRGVVNHSEEPHTFLANGKAQLQAWGEIGSAIRAYDYMDGTSNRYGVHTVMLIVDGVEVFRSTVDRFSNYESRMINSWTHGSYMKSFVDPGNTLRMLKAKNGNRGLVTINEERDYNFLYVLKDIYGNTSRYNFVVHGKRQPIEPADNSGKYFFRWDQTNFIKEPGLDLIVRRGELYDDANLHFAMRYDSGAISYTYQLHDKRIPLHSGADLQIGVFRHPLADTTKYYIARVADDGELLNAGGRYENGFVKTRIRELATYTVAIDTVPPEVHHVARERWARNGTIVYKISDAQTGIRSYRGTIDGKYALFGLHIMGNRLEYKIDPKRVKRGGLHHVEMTVTDERGNQTVVRDTFEW